MWRVTVTLFVQKLAKHRNVANQMHPSSSKPAFVTNCKRHKRRFEISTSESVYLPTWETATVSVTCWVSDHFATVWSQNAEIRANHVKTYAISVNAKVSNFKCFHISFRQQWNPYNKQKKCLTFAQQMRFQRWDHHLIRHWPCESLRKAIIWWFATAKLTSVCYSEHLVWLHWISSVQLDCNTTQQPMKETTVPDPVVDKLLSEMECYSSSKQFLQCFKPFCRFVLNVDWSLLRKSTRSIGTQEFFYRMMWTLFK